uniref:Glycosyltransferase family 92 protein n=1 Tax=Caenorhabditis tropicalis TaxID=1561998 RepID=A0A1I7V409_9PELO
MRRDVFCRSFDRYHACFGVLLVIFVVTAYFSYPEVYSRIPRRVRDVARYVPVYGSPETPNLTTKEVPLFDFNSTDCPVEEWNQIRTSVIPNSEIHEEWVKQDYKKYLKNYLYHDSPSVLAAFAFKDQIILEPSHYLTVCMATLYGDEPKFLQIVDFIEYYKLQGATFFHIYLREVTGYDRVLLDDYVRTGDVEVIKMHDHFWRDDFMWHNAQINDCHHRNKYFSKWTAVVDIDERIEMRSDEFKTITSFLDSIHNSSIVNLHFHVQWVIKQENTPAKYENDEQLIREMLFHKYQNISQVGELWDQPKCIIRPEKIGIMTIHLPLAVYSGEQFTPVNPSIGVVRPTRHYRNTELRVFPLALERMMSHAPFNILPISNWIDSELTKAILARVKWIYDVGDEPCSRKQRTYLLHDDMQAPCWTGNQTVVD